MDHIIYTDYTANQRSFIYRSLATQHAVSESIHGPVG